MTGFWDKYIIPVLTISVGFVLVLVGALMELDGLYSLGLIILGSGLGLPLNGKWSDPRLFVK